MYSLTNRGADGVPKPCFRQFVYVAGADPRSALSGGAWSDGDLDVRARAVPLADIAEAFRNCVLRFGSDPHQQRLRVPVTCGSIVGGRDDLRSRMSVAGSVCSGGYCWGRCSSPVPAARFPEPRRPHRGRPCSAPIRHRPRHRRGRWPSSSIIHAQCSGPMTSPVSGSRVPENRRWTRGPATVAGGHPRNRAAHE